MDEYRIFETTQFAKDLRELSKSGQTAVMRKLQRVVYPQLKQHPRFGPNIRKLKGYTPDTWRYRIGAWRFFFEINGDGRTVFMTAAAHRGSAY